MLILSLTLSVVIALAAAWLLYRADRKRTVRYPMLLAGLRGTLVFLCLLLVCSPKIKQRKTETQKPVIALVQDNSRSVANALGNGKSQYEQDLKKLITKLSERYKVVTRNLDGPAGKDSLNTYGAPTTDITKAINATTELYGQQNLCAVILASDGWYNEGANPLYAELPLNGSFYSIAIGDTALAQDIRIAKIYANRTTSLNSQWEVRADILAYRCAGTQQKVSLQDASGNIIATAPLNIDRDRFDASVSFSVKADKAGLQQYTLSIPKTGEEQNIANNRSSVFVEVVQEKKKVLIYAAAPHPDVKAIQEALKSLEQYEVNVKMAYEAPSSFDGYACIILHQLPSGTVPLTETVLRNKGTWFIAGIGTNYTQLNSLQQAVSFNAGINPHIAEAQFNKGFNTFTLPANIAAVCDILPPLSVSAADYALLPAAQSIFNDPAGRPLWALLSGRTPVALTCGEGLWRWRLYEYKNFKRQEGIDECIRQTVNFLTANNNLRPFRTELPKYIWSNPEHIGISAFLYNANNEPINQPEAKISVKDSSGGVRNFSFERNGSSYRLDLGALPAGRYIYIATTTLNGKAFSDEGRFMVEATNLEDQESGCNYPLLYALAQKNNGATFTPAMMDALLDSITRNNNIKPLLYEQTELSELISWKWLFFLILLLAAAEWLLRKYWLAM